MDTTLTPAAQIIVSIIPIVGIVFGAVIVFFMLLWRHREIKLRIKNNSYTATKFNWLAFTLLFGMCLMGVGLVLTVMFALLEGKSWALLGGLIPTVLGFVLCLFYNIISKSNGDDN